jgi:hypothetical protein
MFSPIIRSTCLYLQHELLPAATWVNTTRCCKYSQVLMTMGEKIGPKHVELTRNNKLTYIVASCLLFS